MLRRAQQLAVHQVEMQERQQRQAATIAQHQSSTSPFSPNKYDASGGSFSYHSTPQVEPRKSTGIYAKPQVNQGTSSFKQTGQGNFKIFLMQFFTLVKSLSCRNFIEYRKTYQS